MITELLAKTAALYITGAPLLSPTRALATHKTEKRNGKGYGARKSNTTFSVGKTRQVKKVRSSVNVLPMAPLPGDVIYVKRMGDLYRHYGIYAGNNRVIHYAGNGGDWGDDVSIHEAPLREFLQGARRFAVCEFKTHCEISGYHLYTREETLQRAYRRLGERNYNLITNNCEHFAIWCRTGISSSSQVKEAGKTICGVFNLVDLLVG